MSITTASLSRTGGLCAVVAGITYILIQLVHPAEELAVVPSTGWVATALLTTTMAVLAIVGLGTVYLQQVRESGWAGLIGYLLFATGFLVVVCYSFVEAVVLPLLTESAPTLVEDLLALPGGGTVAGDVGLFTVANGVAGAGYLLGGLVLGVGFARAGVVPRWTGVLLAAAAVITLAVPAVPKELARLMAVPMGVAWISLGWATRARAGEAVPTRSTRPATAPALPR